MDRQIVYVGQIPQDTDLLNTNKNGMIGIGMLAQALLGTTTWFDGLACTPTSPASLQVILGQGSVFSVANVDGSAYGSLAADTSHQIVKQGIILGNTTLPVSGNFSVPSTTGQSVNYLIEAEYQDVDTGSTVLPYYNASNPAVAYSGPGNAGTAQNTKRTGQVVIQIKAGTAATSGSQVTPTPDAGFTGLWVVTVANGATTITSGNINRYSGSNSATGSTAAWGAPFIPEKLNDKISIATGDLRYMPIGGGSSRTRLSNNLNLYVATTGSDSNSGTNSSPFATIQKAINVLLNNYDLAGFNATINVGNGTYQSFYVNAPFVGTGTVQIVGNTATPASCVINPTGANAGGYLDCVTVTNNAVLSISGFTIENTIGGGITCSNGGRLTINGNMTYAAVTASGAAHIFSGTDGTVSISSPYTITGSATSHVNAQNTGTLNMGGVAVTVTGTPTFSNCFAFAQVSSQIYAIGVTFSGSATGQSFQSLLGATIETNTGNTSFFPGNSAGTVGATGLQGYFT